MNKDYDKSSLEDYPSIMENGEGIIDEELVLVHSALLISIGRWILDVSN
jgi:hypothetical protein